MASTPNDDQPRFVYGEETRYAVVSYRGKAHYIGPFTDRESAITAAKALCRNLGWTGDSFV